MTEAAGTIVIHRCCMCPQHDSSCPICAKATRCRFVQKFKDSRGWIYQVQPTRSGVFQVFYSRPEKLRSKICTAFPRRDSFDRAQEDLNTHAKAKGWKEIL